MFLRILWQTLQGEQIFRWVILHLNNTRSHGCSLPWQMSHTEEGKQDSSLPWAMSYEEREQVCSTTGRKHVEVIHCNFFSTLNLKLDETVYEQYFKPVLNTVPSPRLDLRLNFAVSLIHILRTHLNHFFFFFFYLHVQFVCKLAEESLTRSSMTYFDECKMSAVKLLISSKWSKLFKNSL